MSDVFISYAHEDQGVIRTMTQALEAEGLSVWWDHSIPPGQSWDTFIARGIKEAKVAIVVWSPHSVESDWVKEEATIARAGGKYLPVQIGGAEPPLGFTRIQAAQLVGWNGNTSDPQWQMLLREARRIMEAGGGAPRPGPASSSAQRPPSTPIVEKPKGLPLPAIFAIGGVALALGIAAVFLNQPQQNASTDTTYVEATTTAVAPPQELPPSFIETLIGDWHYEQAWSEGSTRDGTATFGRDGTVVFVNPSVDHPQNGTWRVSGTHLNINSPVEYDTGTMTLLFECDQRSATSVICSAAFDASANQTTTGTMTLTR